MGTEAPGEQTLKPVDEMTVDELRQELVDRNIAVGGRVNKDALKEIVRAARATGEGDEPTPENEDEEPETVEGTVEEEGETPDPEPQPAAAPAQEPTAESVADEVGHALALREKSVEPTTALPSPAEFNASLAIAESIASTTFVPTSYRGRPADVLAAILFGREIGLGPMTALRDVYMIDGRPALAAHRQLAALRKGGVMILESEATSSRAYIRAQRQDTGEIMAVEFTYEEAEKVDNGKLVDKKNWRSYPADMLWARCVGRLTRRLGPDLLGGLPPYVAEEVADFSGWGVEYDDTGAPKLSQPSDVRREQSRVETPRSWAEINAWAEPYGAHLGWREWVAQASAHLFGDVAAADLTRDQRNTLGQKASGAIIALREAADPAAFPPVTRDVVQKAWASVLDGAILEGPPWRMAPDEADRPVQEDPSGERAGSQAEEEGPRSPTPPDGGPDESGAGDGGTHSGADTSDEAVDDAEFVPLFDEDSDYPGYGG